MCRVDVHFACPLGRRTAAGHPDRRIRLFGTQPLIRPRHIARIRTGELTSRKECIGTLLNILRFPRKPRFSGGICHVAQPEIVEWPRHRAFFLHCPHTVKQKLAEIDMLRTDFLAKPAVVAGADQSGRPRTIAR